MNPIKTKRKHTRRRRAAAAGCIFLTVFTMLSGCARPADTEANASPLTPVTDKIFKDAVTADALSAHFLLKNPADYGITDIEPTFGRISLEDMKTSVTEAQDILKTLEAIDDSTLSEDEQLTKEILIDSFEDSVILNQYPLLQEPVNPLSGQQAMLPILTNEYTFYTEADVDTYLKLLEDTKPFFESILDFEKAKADAGTFMTEEILDTVLDQCKSFSGNVDENLMVTTFPDKLDAELPDLDEKTRSDYIQKNKTAVEKYVITAYDYLYDGLEALRGKCSKGGALADYKNGKEYYAALIKAQTGTNMTPEAMASLLEEKMQEAITQFSFSAMADPRVMEAYQNNDLKGKTDEPKPLLDELSSLITEDFPEAADVSFEVKYVDEALRDYLSPAFYLIPPLDAYTDNTIYINSAPENAKDIDNIFTTLAHEGYPGHLYQQTYFLNTKPDKVRTVLNYDGYTEGWATYVEMLSYDWAYENQNMADFMRANQQLSLYLSARADIGIHGEGWSRNDFQAYLKNNGFNDSSELVDTLYDIILQSPGNYLSYAVGGIMFDELRMKAEDTLDDKFDLKEFHKFILDIGPAPFDIIEERMDIWMENL